MFCRKCGHEVKEGTKFCVKCGAPLASEAPRSRNTDSVSEPKKEQPESKVQPKEKKKSGKGLIIALICVLIILLGIIAAFLVYYFAQGKGNSNAQWEAEERQESSSDRDDMDVDDGDEDVDGTERAGNEDIAATEDVGNTEMAAEVQDAAAESDVPHTYQIVVADVTWTEAYSQARNVENGYLVNINSQEEWELVMQLIQEQGYEDKIFWIGAMRKGTSYEYYWVDGDGESVGGSLNESSHWLTGEPTYYDADNGLDERYVEMFYSSSLNQWVWNDTPDDLLSVVPYYSGKIAYIIEIEG